MKILRKITENPYINIAVGLLLLYAGASEAWREIQEAQVAIGAHHGVILFALLNILKSVPDIFEALDYIQK